MVILGAIEWFVIVLACYFGMDFDPTPIVEWLDSHYGA